MRTIKFRGKASHNGEWLYGDLINVHGEYHILGEYDMCEDGHHVTQDSDRPTWVEPDTIGQFTGLYDKNGNEIYEGDILQWGEGDYKIKQVVMFLHGAFGYKCDPYTFVSYVGNSNFNFWAKGTDNRFEIIGNIHDNPELQKGE